LGAATTSVEDRAETGAGDAFAEAPGPASKVAAIAVTATSAHIREITLAE